MAISSGIFWWGFFQPVALQAFFNTGLDCRQQVLSVKVRTVIIIRKSSALHRPDCVNWTPFNHSVICLKNAGTVIFYLESMAVFHETFANLSVWDGKVPGKTVYIICINQQDWSFKPVTAVAGTVITVIHCWLLCFNTFLTLFDMIPGCLDMRISATRATTRFRETGSIFKDKTT